MKAVILAAGMATRLRPLTNDRPKCLLEVGGRSLLGRTIDNVLAAGVAELTIVTGYLHEMIEKYVAEHYPKLAVRYIYNEVYATTNNIFSLYLARPEVEGSDFLLLDSDILFDGQIIKELLAQDDTCLALNRHKCGEEEIKVIADSQGRVVELSKTCSIAHAIGESIGIERIRADYSTALFRELELMIDGPEHLDNVFYERCFERLIPQGYMFRYIDTTQYRAVELDTVADFEAASHF